MTNPYGGSSNVTVTTNIDNARNSQINYNKNKLQAPFTQYGPYSNVDGMDMMSADGAVDHNQFEVMSAGAKPKYRAPQTMQEFQHSNNRFDDALSDNYGMRQNVPSYHKMKDKLNNMRKKNANNVVNSILGSGVKKPVKAPRKETREEEEAELGQMIDESVS